MTAAPILHNSAYALWTGLEAEFDRYHAAISYIPIDKARLQEDLRRYLCLRCAGFLEKVTFDSIHRFLESGSGGPVLEFSKSMFYKSPNLTPATFRVLMARFGEEQARKFDAFLSPQLRESLTDLSSIRNTIAHGEFQGGQKLNPDRYRILCQAVYVWLSTEFLQPIGSHSFIADETKESHLPQ